MTNIDSPRYIRIALDLAYRIYSGEFKVGEKVRGRSTLSSKYGVSPETIRRAISLLKDMNVVTVSEKSGIYIKSYENAYLFIQKFNDENNLKQLRQKIKELKEKKDKIEVELNKNLDLLLEYSIQLEKADSSNHYEIEIPNDSHIVNKTICDTEFWKHTNATIIAIERNSEIYVSPGPYFIFKEGDIIKFICNEANINKVRSYIEVTE
ncbi:TrkA C-terminal domain-containing protein [Haloimpatiens massiliensis]|uniref:TrkA C-terminal domain-containing protein n=1 Tax=Haloimpatiens massiliensis TaxID=1658110 RepID=UPI000C82E8C6|nr:TrkA C-terminal domain-containing protein [Haloimpatiens massiliensis]